MQNLLTRLNHLALATGLSPDALLTKMISTAENSLFAAKDISNADTQQEATQVVETKKERRRRWTKSARLAQSQRIKDAWARKKAALLPKKRGRKPGFTLTPEQKAALHNGLHNYRLTRRQGQLLV